MPSESLIPYPTAGNRLPYRSSLKRNPILEAVMAQPNFKFQKRPKELERKKKHAETLQRKQEKGASLSEDEPRLPDDEENAPLPE